MTSLQEIYKYESYIELNLKEKIPKEKNKLCISRIISEIVAIENENLKDFLICEIETYMKINSLGSLIDREDFFEHISEKHKISIYIHLSKNIKSNL